MDIKKTIIDYLVLLLDKLKVKNPKLFAIVFIALTILNWLLINNTFVIPTPEFLIKYIGDLHILITIIISTVVSLIGLHTADFLRDKGLKTTAGPAKQIN